MKKRINNDRNHVNTSLEHKKAQHVKKLVQKNFSEELRIVSSLNSQQMLPSN